MRIEVDPDKLFDSPYVESMDELFAFDTFLIKDLAEDIKFGKPTCYLISGYRGAGKSSFIKKVETEIKKQKTSDEKIIFVHTNFSRYKSQTYLLRKLIRGLYQELISKDNIDEFKKLKEQEQKDNKEDDKRATLLLERLYEKTFHDVVHSSGNKNEKEITVEIDSDFIQLAVFGVVFIISILNLIFDWFNVIRLLSIVAMAGSMIAGIQKYITIKAKQKYSESESKEFYRKTLYDDEIADYHFFNVINGLSENKYKIVFVLDELDKVDDIEASNLINEMKPYLVSGVASFIVVAGQQLYYEYHAAGTSNDAPLTTLFSRVIHIPLMSIHEFPSLFSRMLMMNKGANPPFQFPDGWRTYTDYLTFKSKRVPRKFINLIRQNINWENGKAFLEINKKESELKTFKSILASIDKIDDKEISVKFTDALRDYYNMELFIKAEKILAMSSKNFNFSFKDLQ